MKKIEEHFSMKYAQVFIAVFIALLVIFYFSIRVLIHEEELFLYNTVSVLMSIILSVMLGVAYSFLKKRQNRMLHDIREIDNYIHKISQDKNYDAIVKVEYYIDLLQIAVSLKNMVKRLEKKDRKSSKK